MMDVDCRKSLGTIIAAVFLIGGLIGAVLFYKIPQLYPNWFMGIMSFFLLFESFEVWYIERSSLSDNPRQLLNSYLLTKIVKMFGSAIFFGLYALIVGEGLKNFALIFIIFYIIFLFIETWIFVKIEKRLKNKKQNTIE